jgi:hypothetical protein
MLQTAVDLLLTIFVIIIDHAMNCEPIIVIVGVAVLISIVGVLFSFLNFAKGRRRK